MLTVDRYRDTWLQKQRQERRQCVIFGFIAVLVMLVLVAGIMVAVWWIRKRW